MYEGPASSLAVVREGLDLAESRGIVETALQVRGTLVEFLYLTGNWDDVLVEAENLREASTWLSLRGMVSVVGGVLLSRGDLVGAVSHLDGVIDATRKAGEVQHLIMGFSVSAAAALAGGDAPTARRLMDELLLVPELRESYNFPAYLPELVRNSIAAGRHCTRGRVPRRLRDRRAHASACLEPCRCADRRGAR